MSRNNKNDPELQELGARLAEEAASEPIIDLSVRESLRAELLSKFGGEKKKEENDLLTPHEVAAICRVHITTVRRWIVCGDLAAIMLPHYGKWRQYRVRRCDLEERLGLAK